MKKIVDMMQEGGGEMRVDQYLFVFLKCGSTQDTSRTHCMYG